MRVSGRLFDGLRVIDCASYIAGPAAATVMSDFGADIIKIEPRGAGDPYRTRATTPAGYAHPVSPNWVLDARNKKSLALDLASAEGSAVLRRLVGDADVFITNFPPKVRRSLAITYEALAPLNERLIYASFTGYGEAGPEADKPGFDATAWWARSGLMHLVRAGDDATPARSLPGMGDHPSAMAMYAAIATALYQRERTGKGGVVGSSLLMNGLWANGCSVQAALCGERVAVQPHRTRQPAPLRNHYRTADGRWLLLSIPNERRWAELQRAMDGGELDDPRFATAEGRARHARDLTAVLDTLFARHPLAQWRARLDGAGVLFSIVADMDDIRTDRQAREAGALVAFEGSDLYTVSSPFWIGGQEKRAPRPAPKLGEHSDQVLREAGYAESEIARLRDQGVIG